MLGWYRSNTMPANEVMGKWKRGELHSGSKSGPVVKNQKQAVAIMESEKRAGLAKGGPTDTNWIGPARAKMEEKGTVGSLRAATHTPKGKNIPEATERKLAQSGSPAMRKKA